MKACRDLPTNRSVISAARERRSAVLYTQEGALLSPSMIPFLHLGPLTIPTFGLMVALGLLAAAYLLQADYDRRREQFVKSGYQKVAAKPGIHDEGFLFFATPGLAALGGALLYNVSKAPEI